MKTSILLFIMLVTLTAFAQMDKLRGTWISPEQDCIRIDTSSMYATSIMLCTASREKPLELTLLGDTLSFKNRYTGSRPIERYDLLILSKTDTSLNVSPVSPLAQKFFNNKNELRLIKQEFTKDKDIRFLKIVYHTTGCFGDCPVIDLEIDNNKNLYINGDFKIRLGNKDIYGPFRATLTDSLYSELIDILQTSNLQTLTFPQVIGFDGSTTTLIIYYNDKRKYLRSMFPPIIADKLISYLYLIKDRVSLVATKEECEIEDEPKPPVPHFHSHEK